MLKLLIITEEFIMPRDLPPIHPSEILKEDFMLSEFNSDEKELK